MARSATPGSAARALIVEGAPNRCAARGRVGHRKGIELTGGGAGMRASSGIPCHGSAAERHNPVPCSSRLRSTRAGPSRRSCSSRWSATSRCTRALAHGPPRGRARGPRAGGGWPRGAAACCVLFVALISPVDRLGEQLASMHMVQHLLIADIAAILLTLGLTRWILRPATRRIHRIERAAGPFASPVRSASSPTSARCGSGTCPRSTTPRSARRRSTCSSTSRSPPPGSCTGGTCCRRSARGCGSAGMGPIAYMVVDEAARRLPRHRARVLAEPDLRLLRHAGTGGA